MRNRDHIELKNSALLQFRELLEPYDKTAYVAENYPSSSIAAGQKLRRITHR